VLTGVPTARRGPLVGTPGVDGTVVGGGWLHRGVTSLPTLAPDQAAVLASWDAPLLVLGGPGTGKTTLLAHAAVARSLSGDPAPLVLAASRTAASALRNTIAAGLGDGSWQRALTLREPTAERTRIRTALAPRLTDEIVARVRGRTAAPRRD